MTRPQHAKPNSAPTNRNTMANTSPETEQKILAHIDSEWVKFRRAYLERRIVEDGALYAAAKAGFYGGFKAGVCAMHDADKIL